MWDETLELACLADHLATAVINLVVQLDKADTLIPATAAHTYAGLSFAALEVRKQSGLAYVRRNEREWMEKRAIENGEAP